MSKPTPEDDVNDLIEDCDSIIALLKKNQTALGRWSIGSEHWIEVNLTSDEISFLTSTLETDGKKIAKINIFSDKIGGTLPQLAQQIVDAHASAFYFATSMEQGRIHQTDYGKVLNRIYQLKQSLQNFESNYRIQKSYASGISNNYDEISVSHKGRIDWGKTGVLVTIMLFIIGTAITIAVGYYFYNLQLVDNNKVNPIPLEDNSILDSTNLLTLPSPAITPGFTASNEVFLTSVSNQKFIASPLQKLTLKIKIQYSTGENPNQITQAFFLPSWSKSWPPNEGEYYKLSDEIPLLSPGAEKEYTISFIAPNKEGTYYLWLGMGSFYSIDDAIKSFKNEPHLPAHIKFLVKKI